MKYEVIEAFHDKRTSKRYKPGSIYETSDYERSEFLQNQGFIGESVENDDPEGDELDPRIEELGGGYYLLPNGEKVRGKKKAIEAIVELDAEIKTRTLDDEDDNSDIDTRNLSDDPVPDEKE